MDKKLPFWNPEQFQHKRYYLAIRNALKARISVHLSESGCVEVDTPVLQVCPGMEVHIRPFNSELNGNHPNHKWQRYLHTSPELSMKKLLVAGCGDIFQFAHVFRNGERSQTHHPEFTMLEWYRVNRNYEKIMDDCEAILKDVVNVLEINEFQFGDLKSNPNLPWEKITVRDAFLQYANVDIEPSISDNPWKPKRELLAKEAEKIGVRISEIDSWEDIFFRIYLERIERNLGVRQPTILYEYPLSMAALSKCSQKNPLYAERFELYICGLELANAFTELTDSEEQLKRFQDDQKLKQELYSYKIPIDYDFIEALRYGMPDSAGIALGFDRLVMLASGAKHIEDVLWAPVSFD